MKRKLLRLCAAIFVGVATAYASVNRYAYNIIDCFTYKVGDSALGVYWCTGVGGHTAESTGPVFTVPKRDWWLPVETGFLNRTYYTTNCIYVLQFKQYACVFGHWTAAAPRCTVGESAYYLSN